MNTPRAPGPPDTPGTIPTEALVNWLNKQVDELAAAELKLRDQISDGLGGEDRAFRLGEVSGARQAWQALAAFIMTITTEGSGEVGDLYERITAGMDDTES